MNNATMVTRYGRGTYDLATEEPSQEFCYYAVDALEIDHVERLVGWGPYIDCYRILMIDDTFVYVFSDGLDVEISRELELDEAEKFAAWLEGQGHAVTDRGGPAHVAGCATMHNEWARAIYDSLWTRYCDETEVSS